MIRNIAQAVRQSLNSNPGRANPRLNFSSASNPEAGFSTAPSIGPSNISSSDPVVVTLLSPDENLSRDLFREFGQPSTHYELKTIVGMFNPESCEKLCNGYAPDILLLDLDAIKGNQIAFERFRTQVLHHSPIIALSDNLSVEAVIMLGRYSRSRVYNQHQSNLPNRLQDDDVQIEAVKDDTNREPSVRSDVIDAKIRIHRNLHVSHGVN